MARSFDRVAAVYDATRQLPATVEESIAAGIARHTGATAATRFLEVGVGTGRIAVPLLRRGHHLCGVDAAAAMLAAAQHKARGGPGRLDLVRGDALALPFAPATFDVGLVVHLFHLLPDWRGALDELFRVIRPGGFFLYGAEQPDEAAEPDHFAERWRAALSPARPDPAQSPRDRHGGRGDAARARRSVHDRDAGPLATPRVRPADPGAVRQPRLQLVVGDSRADLPRGQCRTRHLGDRPPP